jgi:hypothetical protein
LGGRGEGKSLIKKERSRHTKTHKDFPNYSKQNFLNLKTAAAYRLATDIVIRKSPAILSL